MTNLYLVCAVIFFLALMVSGLSGRIRWMTKLRRHIVIGLFPVWIFVIFSAPYLPGGIAFLLLIAAMLWPVWLAWATGYLIGSAYADRRTTVS